MIRKIPLLGNCDLTNFHADIHDYEGFAEEQYTKLLKQVTEKINGKKNSGYL